MPYCYHIHSVGMTELQIVVIAVAAGFVVADTVPLADLEIVAIVHIV
jgi:hypothetical protein